MERLALIEVLDQDSRVVHAVPVTRWPVSVGRSLDCDVVLQDPYVAAHHVLLDTAAEGPPGVVLTAGASVNGVQIGRRLLGPGASVRLPAGSEFRAGLTALRVRLAGEELAAERPLRHAEHMRLLGTAGALAALLLWIAGLLWLENVPGAGWDNYVPQLLGALFAVAAWSSLWGLGSKLFQRHFRFLPHLHLLLGFVLAILSVDALLALASFALSAPWLSHIRGWVRIVMIAALLSAHVSLLLPNRRRAVALAFALLCLLVLSVDGALTWRHHQRLFDELYAATLAPPALRLARTEPVGKLLDSLLPLRASLEQRARQDEADDATSER